MVGLNDKYVKSYKVSHCADKTPSTLWKCSEIKESSTHTYSFTYGWSGDKVEYTFGFASEVNPYGQNIDTVEIGNKATWTAKPNSHKTNSSWFLNVSSVICTTSGNDSYIWIGVDELIVDNWLLQYKSPCPNALKIIIKK